MTNAQLKRKAKQIALLVEIGLITPEQAKRKVRPQVWNDYVLPLLKREYIPLTVARAYQVFGILNRIKYTIPEDWIKTELVFANFTMKKCQEAIVDNSIEDLAILTGKITNKPTYKDYIMDIVNKTFNEAQAKTNYYTRKYPKIAADVFGTGLAKKFKPSNEFLNALKAKGE